jgi:Druantia protein DruA
MLKKNNPMITCCGRPITHGEVAQIQETVKLFVNLSRKELAHTICEHLEWRTASGTNKLDACLKMLKLFEKKELIQLPAKKLQSKPQTPQIIFSSATDPSPVISGRLKEIGPIEISQASTHPQVKLWNEYMARYHYLGYNRPFGYAMRYTIQNKTHPLGCILFSGAAKAIGIRDQWIGWDANQRLQNLAWVVNNTRFLIFPWVNVKNLASHVLGKIGRRIGRDWEKQWGFHPVLMETFVDPEHYQGTCYKAANWTELGLTTGKGLARTPKSYHTSPKKLFVRPLIQNFRKTLIERKSTWARGHRTSAPLDRYGSKETLNLNKLNLPQPDRRKGDHP